MSVTCHNFSTLKHLSRGIEHYLYARDHEQADTPAMLLGRAVHTSVLEPDRFPLLYAVWNGGRRQGKEWERVRDLAHDEGRDVITADEYAQCLAIRNSVRNDPAAAALLERVTEFERKLEWTDTITGLPCSGRVDGIGAGRVLELKTTSDVRPRVFAAHAARMCYHAQLAMYVDGSGSNTASIIAVEQKPPYAVQVFYVPELTLEAGRYQYRGWLQMARDVDQFMGREPVALELPVWAGQVEDDDVDFSDV